MIDESDDARMIDSCVKLNLAVGGQDFLLRGGFEGNALHDEGGTVVDADYSENRGSASLSETTFDVIIFHWIFFFFFCSQTLKKKNNKKADIEFVRWSYFFD